jgi:hypothetical protein
MASTKISQLEIASSVKGSDFIIIDNTEVTRRYAIGNLIDTLSRLIGNSQIQSISSTIFTELSNTLVNTLSGLANNSQIQTISSTIFTELSNTIVNTNWNIPSLTITNVSGLIYKLQLSDAGTYIRKSHDSPHYITIPRNDDVEYTIGTNIVIRNASSNLLTISGDSGVELSYFVDLSANILDPNTSAQIVYTGTNNWDIV